MEPFLPSYLRRSAGQQWVLRLPLGWTPTAVLAVPQRVPEEDAFGSRGAMQVGSSRQACGRPDPGPLQLLPSAMLQGITVGKASGWLQIQVFELASSETPATLRGPREVTPSRRRLSGELRFAAGCESCS